MIFHAPDYFPVYWKELDKSDIISQQIKLHFSFMQKVFVIHAKGPQCNDSIQTSQEMPALHGNSRIHISQKHGLDYQVNKYKIPSSKIFSIFTYI